MNQLLWIAIGGALGAVLRYLLVLGVSPITASGFPYPILLVNVLGCFGIGILYAAFGAKANFESTLRPFLIIGILGGFTTFSSFAMESIHLFQNKEAAKAFLYIFASNGLGLGAAWLGYQLFST